VDGCCCATAAKCLEQTALVAEVERNMAEDDMLPAQNSTAARSLIEVIPVPARP
jgi:hypothetical protein